MLIASKTIPEIQKAMELGLSAPAPRNGSFDVSLSALLYLALAGNAGLANGDAGTARFLAGLALPKLSSLIELATGDGAQKAPNLFGTYAFEAYRICGKQDLLSEGWTLFCDRFRRSASRGKQSQAVLAVASVFREMADNVVWHAYSDADRPCKAMAGYFVSDACISFSVADRGQGFLRSLQRNKVWKSLSSDNQALDAVVSKQATSRQGEQCGGGFKQLFNGLLDLNGLVILRSGTSTFTLRNEGSCWQRVESEAHPVPGSQVTVVIGRRGIAMEEQIP